MTHRPRSAASGRRKIAGVLHRWHRRIGVAASLFILWLVISGWLLNHTDTLGLAQRQTHATALLAWYGLKGETPAHVMLTANHWLVADGEAVALDGKLLSVAPIQPLGMTETNGILFVASASSLILISPSGDLIDTVRSSMLPLKEITRIGTGCNGVVIENDNRRFASDDGVTWHSCAADVAWAKEAPITPAQLATVEPLLRPGISFERLLLDVHSGRIFGAWGPYLIDAIGGGLVLLALSGLWMFSHQRARHRQHRPHVRNRPKAHLK